MRDRRIDRDERRQILVEIRQRLGEALIAHEISDDESELLLLDQHLDAEQTRLDHDGKRTE